MTMKKSLIVVCCAAVLALAGCGGSDASVASKNLSTAADQFQIDRRITFFNGITDKYLLVIEGRCAINVDDVNKKLDVTCKTGPNEYKKEFLGLSDNVSYFVEQLAPVPVDVYHYKVIFKPETIVPEINVNTSGGK
jgi:hypothetical protein